MNKNIVYEIIESKWWKHTSGRTVSIYGALPWFGDAQKAEWRMETVGWTVRNRSTGIVGIGRVPFKSHAEALTWINS